MAKLTTMNITPELKEKLGELRISERQAYYEVVDALLRYFEEHAENKLELWKNRMEVGKTKV